MGVIHIPSWLDQVLGVDFGPEKQLLAELEKWAAQDGWIVSDGRTLPFELRQRTDVLIEKPDEHKRVRVAVLQKGQNGTGEIRLDSSDSVTIELIYNESENAWSVEAGNVVLSTGQQSLDCARLFERLFRR
jgi:hypothetical protein